MFVHCQSLYCGKDSVSKLVIFKTGFITEFGNLMISIPKIIIAFLYMNLNIEQLLKDYVLSHE
jgi:hypothetical protein